MSDMIVGLTGGIGSGKSAAADIFARLGVPVVDVDLIAHNLTGPSGEAMPAIRQAFGDWALAPDGRLDRAAMRRQAFADPGVRKRLEAVLHPLIRAESERRCARALATGVPYMVLVVPLLVESGDYRQRVQRIAVVDCPDEIRIARVIARSGLSRSQIEAILTTQASRQDRLAAADDVILNEGSLDQLAIQVEQLHRRYLALAAGVRPVAEKDRFG